MARLTEHRIGRGQQERQMQFAKAIPLAIVVWVLATYAPVATADLLANRWDYNSVEGWGIGGSGGDLRDDGSGGNPGGFLVVEDELGFPKTTEDIFLIASGLYDGNLQWLDGGTLSFDIEVVGLSGSAPDPVGPFLEEFGVVTITDGVMAASLDLVTAAPPIRTWASYSASLSAMDWGVSQSEWTALLSSVTDIPITFEAFAERGEVIGLDNFVMDGGSNVRPGSSQVVPVPSSVLLGMIGFCMVGWMRRRF